LTSTEKTRGTTPTIPINNTPQDLGVIVAWKDGMVSSTLGTTTYEENAREKCINVGLDHATKLLGKLHEDECDSPRAWREHPSTRF
jgi:hypothetical protein